MAASIAPKLASPGGRDLAADPLRFDAVMDRMRFSTIGHRFLDVCSPIAPDRLERLLDALALAPGNRVLDVGCGKGAMLARLAERHGTHGLGVDLNPAFLDQARARAARLGAGTMELRQTDAARLDCAPASFDAALCVGATYVLGGYRATLDLLAIWIRPGGRALIGEGYWKRPPDPEYLAAIDGSADECLDHDGNVALAIAAGWKPISCSVSGDEEWDDYEGSYAEGIESWVRERPEDPDAEAMLARIHTWRAAYLRWGRDTMGFGWYVLQAGKLAAHR
jgi:SAM-dependent methyltransferase